MSTTTIYGSALSLEDARADAQVRWHAATKALRQAGFHVRTNVSSCCPGCVSAEKLNYDEGAGKPLLWTWRGQGRETYTDLVTDDGEVMIHHDNIDPEFFEAARTIAAGHGIRLEWNGEHFSCISMSLIRSCSECSQTLTPEEVDRFTHRCLSCSEKAALHRVRADQVQAAVADLKAESDRLLALAANIAHDVRYDREWVGGPQLGLLSGLVTSMAASREALQMAAESA